MPENIIESAEQRLETLHEAPVFKKRRRWPRYIVIAATILLVVGGGLYYFLGMRTASAAPSDVTYTDYTVVTRDITLQLSGTGTLKPADSYTVTALVTGTVLSADFNEGEIVEKDTLLYEIDSADIMNSIEQAELSLEQSRRSYVQKSKSLDDLRIKANESGTIIELDVEVGDKVNANQVVARVRDSSVMLLTVPFVSSSATGFVVGQTADVTLDGSFEVFTGKISEIGAADDWGDSGIATRSVTIEVTNPGGIYLGQVATAVSGGAESVTSGTFAYRAEAVITASASGEVAAVHVKKGGQVSKNQVVVTLSSETLDNELFNSSNSMRNSELSLESRYKQLEDYKIMSPITGTIIEKSVKAGDTLQSAKTLCTIYDLSYLTITLNIDELDIAKINVGQIVSITAEALEGRTYQGYVTKVNIAGTTSNGTTTYPVTIRIDETEGLLPGMNVQATITVSQSVDAVAVPVSALQRGNMVLVKTGAVSGLPESGTTTPDASSTRLTGGIPEGYEIRRVTPGNSDGEYIEITEGLAAGEIIGIVTVTSAATNEQNGAFTFGGMRGGQMPVGEVRTFSSGDMPEFNNSGGVSGVR